MVARSARLFTGGLILAALGLASACAGQPVVSAAAAVSAPSAPSTLSALSASVGAHMASVVDIDGKPVNCGKVGPTGGKQVDLIAEAAPAGTVGCTEAIDVITQYYKAAEAPVAGDGTDRIRKVGKWTCLVDTGVPIKERYIACGSTDGLALHTQP